MARYLTQRQLGVEYGVSSHEIGKWLIAGGLRDKSGRPSALAFLSEVVVKEECQNKGHFFYRWNEDFVDELFQKNGKKKLSPRERRWSL
jgi:hypothetical protein